MTLLRLEPVSLLGTDPSQTGSTSRESAAAGFDEHLQRARDEYASPAESAETDTREHDAAELADETVAGRESRPDAQTAKKSGQAELPSDGEEEDPSTEPSEDPWAQAADAAVTLVVPPPIQLPTEILGGELPDAQAAVGIVGSTASAGGQPNPADGATAVPNMPAGLVELLAGQGNAASQAAGEVMGAQPIDAQESVVVVETPQTQELASQEAGDPAVPQTLSGQTAEGLGRDAKKAAAKARTTDAEATGTVSEAIPSDAAGDVSAATQVDASEAVQSSASRKNANQRSENGERDTLDRVASDAAALPPTATAEAASGTTTELDQNKRGQAVTTERSTSTTASEATTSAARIQGDDSTSGGGVGQASDAEGANQQDQVDRARFVQRVSRAFESFGDRSGTVKIRLSPPELGSLHLEIAVQDGTMTARVEAETSAARNLLLENLPALRDRLAQQDIRVERFDVDLMDHRSNGGQADQSSQFSGQGDRSWQQGQRDEANRGGSAKPAPGAARPRTLTGEGGRLNVVI